MAHKKLCKTLKILAGAAGIAFVGMQLVAKKKKADYTYKNEPEEQNPFCLLYTSDAADEL